MPIIGLYLETPINVAELYTILGISEGATQQEIRAAYRKLAVQYHPDKNPGNAQAEEQFKKINQAYQILSSPTLRAQYDTWAKVQEDGGSQDAWEAREQRKRRRRAQHAREGGRKSDAEEESKPIPYKTIGLVLGIGGLLIFAFMQVYFFMQRKTAEEDFERGKEAYYSYNRLDEAISLVRHSLARDPSFGEAHLFLAHLFHEGKHYTGAYYHFNLGFSLTGDEPTFEQLAELAKCQEAMEKYEEALASLQKALAMGKNDGLVHVQTGELLLYKLWKYQESIVQFDKALKILPQNKAALQGKAIALHRQEQYDASNQLFKQAVQYYPKDGVNYYYLALNRLMGEQDTVVACQWMIFARGMGVREADWYIMNMCERELPSADPKL